MREGCSVVMTEQEGDVDAPEGTRATTHGELGLITDPPHSTRGSQGPSVEPMSGLFIPYSYPPRV